MLFNRFIVLLFFVILAVSAQEKSESSESKDPKQTPSKSKEEGGDSTSKSSKDEPTGSSEKDEGTKTSSKSKTSETGSFRAQLSIDKPAYNEGIKGAYIPLNKPILFEWSIVSGKPHEAPKSLTLSIVEKRSGGDAKYDIATDIPGGDKKYIWDITKYVPDNNEEGISLKTDIEYTFYLYDSELKYNTLNSGRKVKNGAKKARFYQPSANDEKFSASNSKCNIPSLALLSLPALLLL